MGTSCFRTSTSAVSLALPSNLFSIFGFYPLGTETAHTSARFLGPVPAFGLFRGCYEGHIYV